MLASARIDPLYDWWEWVINFAGIRATFFQFQPVEAHGYPSWSWFCWGNFTFPPFHSSCFSNWVFHIILKSYLELWRVFCLYFETKLTKLFVIEETDLNLLNVEWQDMYANDLSWDGNGVNAIITFLLSLMGYSVLCPISLQDVGTT